MRPFYFLCLFNLISFFSPGQSTVNTDLKDAFRLIDVWLDAQQAYDRLPGISAGVVQDQQLIWSKGYGMADVNRKTPATAATVYSICSISKLFTSIAIMQLYEEGKLRLDDTLSRVLPGFNIQQSFGESGPVTIRSLLTHSSGLPRESDYPYWTGPAFSFPTSTQVNARLSEQQTLYPASSLFQYSNLGMTLLGEVVEKVSGKSYDAYVEERILAPLRLSNTKTVLPPAGKMATGYSALNRIGSRDPVTLFDAKGIRAAAGYSSTLEDLALFASWQFRLLKNGGKEILLSSTLKEMQRVHWIDPDWKTSWGLGFVVRQQDGATLVGHSGGCPGYRTTLVLEPKGRLAYIVMLNVMEDAGLYATQIRNIIAKAKKEKPVAGNVDHSAFTGTYNAQPWGSETHVLSWYGKLAVVQFPSHNPAEGMTMLKHVSGDTFRRILSDETLGEEIRFERDKNTGKVVRMWRHSNYSEKLK